MYIPEKILFSTTNVLSRTFSNKYLNYDKRIKDPEMAKLIKEKKFIIIPNLSSTFKIWSIDKTSVTLLDNSLHEIIVVPLQYFKNNVLFNVEIQNGTIMTPLIKCFDQNGLVHLTIAPEEFLNKEPDDKTKHLKKRNRLIVCKELYDNINK